MKLKQDKIDITFKQNNVYLYILKEQNHFNH